MKTALTALLIGVASAAAMYSATAQETHVVLTPDQVEWTAGPKSLPPGAEASVLYGDPSKEGLFSLRLKLPAGYTIAPHTHPKPEIVTVISGSFHLGMGEEADRAKTQALAVGSFVALDPGMAHYVFIDEETVVQLNSTGPWSVNYVDPNYDPQAVATKN